MFSSENHIIEKDNNGWYVGKIIGDIISNKHRLTEESALELAMKWSSRSE